MTWNVTLLGGRHASAPAVCAHLPDSLYLISLSPRHRVQLRRFDGRWGRWIDVADGVVADEAPAAFALGRAAVDASHPTTPAPAAAQRARADRDLVHVFARSTGDHVLHLRYVHGQPAAWDNLGGPLHHGPAVCAPAPTELLLVIAAIGGGLRTRRFHEGAWQPWVALDGPPGGETATPAVTADATSGQIDLVVRGRDGLWHRRFDRGRGWSGWRRVPGDALGAPAVTHLPGRLDVFARDHGGRLSRTFLDHEWHGWERVVDVRLASHPGALASVGARHGFHVAAIGAGGGLRLFEGTDRDAAGRVRFVDVRDDGSSEEVSSDPDDNPDDGDPGDPGPIVNPPEPDPSPEPSPFPGGGGGGE